MCENTARCRGKAKSRTAFRREHARPRTPWRPVLLLALIAVPSLSAAADLSGTWAEIKLLHDTVTYPLVGQLERTTTLICRVSVTQCGASLAIAATYCDAIFDNGSVLTTEIDPAFVCSLPAVVSSATVDSASAPREFAQPWTTELHGVRLEHPDSDPLPTSAADPRVVDQDTDGHPGITVHATALGVITGDVYVIQRLRIRLEGRLVSADRIEGEVEGTVEQVILGASNALFLGSIVSRPEAALERNLFVLQRVDAESSRDDILAQRLALFGR